MNKPATAGPETRIHLPCLLAALVIMISGTLYPPLLTDATGRADHPLASLALLAMSAGFVRGVGFAPRPILLRWLLSGWTCLLTGVAFLALKILT
ncbi:cyd operon YbgE family protein [Bradyrhizobium liaoningense]